MMPRCPLTTETPSFCPRDPFRPCSCAVSGGGRVEAPIPGPTFLGHQQLLPVMSCSFLWVPVLSRTDHHPFGPAGLSSSSPLTRPKATPNAPTRALEHIRIHGFRQRERMGKKSVISYRHYWLGSVTQSPERPGYFLRWENREQNHTLVLSCFPA